MLLVRSRTVRTRSASPAMPHNSPQHMVFQHVAIAREFRAPASPSPSRFRPESTPSNPSAPRGRPFRRRASFPLSAQSSAQTAPLWPCAGATRHSLFPVSPASASWPHAAAVRPIQIPSQGSLPRQAATLAPLFLRCPAPTPSILAPRFPARASTLRTTIHPVLAKPHPAALSLAARAAVLRAQLRPNLLLQSGILLPKPGASRIAPQAHHPQSVSSSCFLPLCIPTAIQ